MDAILSERARRIDEAHELARIIHRGVGLGHFCACCVRKGRFMGGADTGPSFPQVGRRPGVAKFEFAEGSTGIASSG